MPHFTILKAHPNNTLCVKVAIHPWIWVSFFLMLFLAPYLLLLRWIISRVTPEEDMSGKVVLITGASSGIGQRMAYEYGGRGARLALVARRNSVAREASAVGSPADVSNPQHCSTVVPRTIHHFGRLDHLVNNAGVAPVCMLETTPDMPNFLQAMDTNFWGYVNYAIPHLKRSKGKIIVISSAASWLPVPRLALYSASKAAVTSFFETLRVEIGTQVGITIVTPGLTESEMTPGKFLTGRGTLELDQQLRDVMMSITPIMGVKDAARAIVAGAVKGAYYVAVPHWVKTTFLWQVFLPEAVEWCNRLFLLPRPGSAERDTASRQIVEALPSVGRYLRPATVNSPELNDD